ncbi:hypothetical protein GF389_04755 [Candidatus Dojkabacteria bacterium]|nr:hypothetical protein [Candidatus Dojkabacteria bacterium]
MIVPIKELLEKEVIKNRDFGDGEGLVEPEGAAIDIRLGSIWEMDEKSKGFLGKVTRETRKYRKVAEFKPGKSTKFQLIPDRFYQLQSVEEIDVPLDMVGRFVARYNLLANGILILAYKVDPGFKGQFTAPMKNVTNVPFEIELGARYAQFEFHRIDGEGVKYRGQWRDGRVYTEKEEVQV